MDILLLSKGPLVFYQIPSGFPQLIIQDALGHSDISTTMNIYADATKELKKSEFEGLESIFR